MGVDLQCLVTVPEGSLGTSCCLCTDAPVTGLGGTLLAWQSDTAILGWLTGAGHVHQADTRGAASQGSEALPTWGEAGRSALRPGF